MKENDATHTRRKFIQNMVVGSATLSVAPYAFAGRNISIIGLRKKEKMGIALVGLGYYSTDLLAPALQETKNCYLAGM